MGFNTVDIFHIPHFKEKYNSDIHFADNLIPKYKQFELNYNKLLKPKYPSISDELKRQVWYSKKFKLKTKNLETVLKGVRYLLGTNFENVNLINKNNEHLIKYLIEKKTGKIYKVKYFNDKHYYYSTLGNNSILSVRFDIKYNLLKNKIIIKYSQGYLSEQLFSFMTYAETKQHYDAKGEFKQRFKLIKNKFESYFKLLLENGDK